MGEDAERFPFNGLPGVYQAAYVACVRGVPVEPHESEFMWALMDSDSEADYVAVREFPPKTGPTEYTPEPGTAAFFLLPRAVVESLYRTRGW